ncbi:MAG: alanine racemase [Elusimicrobiota bacterium]|jgi:alanine racemase|nr:alanine racemase [Elusimicrobiota bacterium]
MNIRKKEKLNSFHKTWVEIDKKAFISNLRALKNFISKDAKIIPVLKADAYGHGVLALAKEVQKEGVKHLAVFSLDEGLFLRKNGIKTKILLLDRLFLKEAFEKAAHYSIMPSISDIKSLKIFQSIAIKLKRQLPFHLEIDTGMGRTGILAQDAKSLLKKISQMRDIKMAGLFSHFSSAGTDADFTKRQLKDFLDIVKYARFDLKQDFLAHISSSAGILQGANFHIDAVRIGISIYGAAFLREFANIGVKLKPILSWKTQIADIKKVPSNYSISYGRTFITKKPSTIAVLPIGYADGYNRLLSNKAFVLIKGKRCPVIGAVTMNMTMIDISHLKKVSIGSEAVLIGKQAKEEINAQELAQIQGTISYEVLCLISDKIERIVF